MCAVSMIGDFYQDKWQKHVQPQPNPFNPSILPVVSIPPAEFEQLKRDVADLKELLTRAKKYDQDNGEPACEKDEKVALLKAVAKAVGVDLSDVLSS